MQAQKEALVIPQAIFPPPGKIMAYHFLEPYVSDSCLFFFLSVKPSNYFFKYEKEKKPQNIKALKTDILSSIEKADKAT